MAEFSAEKHNGVIVFRVDSSTAMGSGHIMRCLTLANALRAMDYDVYFVCRALPGNLICLAEKQNFRVLQLLYSGDDIEATSSYKEWLGVDWETDAHETISIIAENDIMTEWLIVDNYALDYRWEKMLRPLTKKLMVIDDIANRKHDCDLLLDQNFYDDANMRYCNLVPTDCKLLLGPQYALLRPEFAAARKVLRHRDGTIKRILVFFGGSDPSNETMKALQAIEMLKRPDLIVDVVVGLSNPNIEQIEQKCNQLSNTTFYCQVDNIAKIMSEADIAIGASGTAIWERCSLALPSITITVAENQVDIAANVSRAGIIVYLGSSLEVNTAQIFDSLCLLLMQNERMSKMSACGKMLVDGFGVERVTKLLMKKPLIITIVSDISSWMNEHIFKLISILESNGHIVKLIHDVDKIERGDLAFFLSCGQIVPIEILRKNINNLVVHASDLPKGKGWSPLAWQILEGSNDIPISLFEAVEKVDSGKVYIRETMNCRGTELIDELHSNLADISITMCLNFVNNYPEIVAEGICQSGFSSYYPRRSREDSKLDIHKSIDEQFNLFRVVDNDNYPAFFEKNGVVYILKISAK